MKVVSVFGVAFGLAAAAFAQQSRFPAAKVQSAFTATPPVAIATIPQPPSAPAIQSFTSPRYGYVSPGRLPAAPSGWVDRLGQNSETVKASQEVDSAVAKLKKATSDQDKQDAEDLVKEKLGKLFDLKTESREREITALEKRLEKMREQLEKRSDEKSQIVRLRLQTLVNEANGLTF